MVEFIIEGSRIFQYYWILTYIIRFDMNSIAFDSLSTARQLREKGVPQEQAEAIADAIRVSKDTDFSHLATKEELNTFKSDLRADLAELKAELKMSIADTRSELIKWMFGGFISMAGLLVAVIGVGVSILSKLH
jgi:hypothetical protein